MAEEPQHSSESEKAGPERVKAVRELFVQLRKGVKTIGMYRHSPSRFPEYLRPAYLQLTEVLKEGQLALRVSAESFDFGDEPVWAAEGADNLPGRFFREGVRHLILRPELSEEELTQLVMIMLSNPDRGGSDIVSQLMNASFNHIEHVVVEGFTVGDLTEEQVEVAVDQVVQYLYGRLRSNSDDTLAFARVSAADLELKLEGVEQVRGAVFDGDTFSDSFRERIQQELRKDLEIRLHQQLAQLLFWQIRENRVPDLTAAIDVFTQMVDGMLMREDLRPLITLLDQLRALDTGAESPGAQVRVALGKRLGEDHRLRRLGDALKLNASLDLQASARYLAELDSSAVGPLLDVLEALVQPDRRSLLIDALAVLGKDSPQFFAARLQSEKSQTVRDMIAIVDKAGFPDRAKYIQTAMRNPNTAVRMEVLAILASSKAVESVHRFVLEATLDKSPQVRAAAFRSLVQLSPLRATQDLLRLPKLPDWDKRPQTERELIYECLGYAGTPEVYRHVISLLQQKKSLFAHKKIVESKLLAIVALQNMATVQSFKLLQSVAENKDSDAEVSAAARKAMLQVRRVMSETTRQASPSAAGADAQAEAQSAEIHQAADQLFTDFLQARQENEAETAEIRRRVAEAAAREAAPPAPRPAPAASIPSPAPSVSPAGVALAAPTPRVDRGAATRVVPGPSLRTAAQAPRVDREAASGSPRPQPPAVAAAARPAASLAPAPVGGAAPDQSSAGEAELELDLEIELEPLQPGTKDP